jgi:hypothetical protein
MGVYRPTEGVSVDNCAVCPKPECDSRSLTVNGSSKRYKAPRHRRASLSSSSFHVRNTVYKPPRSEISTALDLPAEHIMKGLKSVLHLLHDRTLTH